ncbi:ATP-binding protein [Streptomyces pseudovenezuelae]|uniref:ATP-binding protein n=1 Tax=Streptomyces pseudovenezuelae TaxID=67350 RepID=UPI0036E2E97E
MTAYPTPGTSQDDTLEVVWQELHGQHLHRVPPHGLARPPRSASPPPYLREVWELPGRSVHTPGKARALVGDTCRRWHVAHRIVPDLKLIVSELATNAILHAPSTGVTVAVLLTATHVWVVVVDQGPRLPVGAGLPGTNDEHGRGLLLVEEFADQSGVLSAGRGTAVWARLQLPPPRPQSGLKTAHAPTQDDTVSPHTAEDADVLRSHP